MQHAIGWDRSFGNPGPSHAVFWQGLSDLPPDYVSEFDEIWDAFKELARLDVEGRKERREARRVRRNELARLRRKSNPKKPIVVPEPEYDEPASCTCSTCSMPPCSWCEKGISDEM